MGVPSGLGVLALVVGVAVLYVAIAIGYRRILFSALPDPDERSPEADQPAGPGERHCPHCGALNDRDFEKCYECNRKLPADSTES